MARFTLLLATILVLPPQLLAAEPCSLEALRWMAGHWQSDRDGTTSEEIWSDAKGGVMLGLHRDTKQDVLLGFEFLRITKVGEDVVYLASPGGREPTPFSLVSCDDRRATFENPDHDFPNRLVYWLDDEDRLHAVAEGFEEGAPRLEWVLDRRR